MNFINQLRDDTPGCHHQIHFNNAGASLPPRSVLQAQLRYTLEEAITGGYELEAEYQPELEQVYHTIARLIGAESREIAMTENATQSWHLAFHSIPFKPGDTILTTDLEYASNYISYLQKKREFNVQIKVIPSGVDGGMDIQKLEEAIDDSTRLISLSHIPTNSGTVNPAEEIGKVARKYKILYLLDACQSIGQYPVDVSVIGCDMLTATGRKYLRAPRGSGFLYVCADVLPQLNPPFLDLHGAEWTSKNSYELRSDARRFENWESNYSIRMGLGKAAQYAINIGLDTIWSRIQQLADKLRQKIKTIDGCTVHDQGTNLCGIVTFNHASLRATEIKSLLAQANMNVSVTTESSARLDMEQKNLFEAVRASVHYYNTANEIDVFISELRNICSRKAQ